jgi:hypothetical protein
MKQVRAASRTALRQFHVQYKHAPHLEELATNVRVIFRFGNAIVPS